MQKTKSQTGKKSFLLDLYFKEQNDSIIKHGKNTVVFIQKGDFYELYSIDPDFPKLCDLLNLACSRANTKKKEPVSINNPMMAGFQWKFAPRYFKILSDKNYNIILIEEQEPEQDSNNKTTGKNKKIKLPKIRKVTRIITPSTYIELAETNILLCIYINGIDCSIASADLSTGKIYLFGEYNYDIELLRNIIAKTNPRELVFFFQEQPELEKFNEQIYQQGNVLIKKKIISKEYTIINYQNIFLSKVYKLSSIGISPLEHLHLEKFPLSSTILTILIQYAIDHDPLLMTNLKAPELIYSNKNLNLSENTVKQLHLYEMYKFLDYTCTNMGSRLLKEKLFNPSVEPKKIQDIYNKINILSKDSIKIRNILKQIRDIDRFQRRVSTLKLNRIEFPDIITSFKSCLDVLNIIKNIENSENVKVFKINDQTINNLQILIKTLEKNINTDISDTRLFIKGNYDDIDELYDQREILMQEFETIREELSLEVYDNDTLLKVGTVNESLYFVMTKKQANDLAKNNDINIGGTQSECRVTTDRTEEIVKTLGNIKEELEQLETMKFIEFCKMISDKFSNTINRVSKIISEIDFCTLGSYLITHCKFVIPELITSNTLHIEQVRHPLIESQINATYVANDLLLNNINRGMLLYGQNFSGKSSYIRSVGLCVILAQAGIPVPAASMKYTPFKQFITKIALEDNLQRGQSTFTNEIKEIKNMIETTNEYSLILSDELCAGTETNSALSLVASTLISLDKNKCRYIFTTHFHDLVDIPQVSSIESLKIYHMKVSIIDGKQVFDRLLKPGKCEDNYGIEIAQHMKMPLEFINQAILIRNNLTNNKEIISSKRSNYNKDIYMTECQICKSKENLHTHHIIFQSKHKGLGKNYKNNLAVICEECHKKVHEGKLELTRYIQTSEGIEMK